MDTGIASHIEALENWFGRRGFRPFRFQKETWEYCIEGRSGLLNAPTGTGKTYAVFVGAVLACLKYNGRDAKGIQIIWITPIRALSKDIANACRELCDGLGLNWQVAVRTGDTSGKERERQKKSKPQILITTPESLHLIMASKGYKVYMSTVRFLVADEWHELMGSKRAVMLELALSRMKQITRLQIWGISATIGNLEESMDVLFGCDSYRAEAVLVRAEMEKMIDIVPIIPDDVEAYPMAGHLGTRLAGGVLPIIDRSKATLIFTNTRSQAEMWYQHILELRPEMAGLIAMHHGSISRELRDWVEDALHEGRLKCVVCTSSLDLGVDFRPVETVIQVGSPKGIARFVQRAGRSGHQPGAKSVIYFLPANSLQLLECVALRRAIEQGDIESRTPYIGSFDVLVQYLVTLAVGDGFVPDNVRPEVKSTYSFAHMDEVEWKWALAFVTTGGSALQAYNEFRKVVINPEGVYHVAERYIAMRHRLSIGAIVSDTMLQVKFQSGGYLGSIEEWFVSRLSPGDTFWFAGRPLELVRIREMTVQVKLSKKKSGNFPSWQGGRMPLSSMLSQNLRFVVANIDRLGHLEEISALKPVLDTQRMLSIIPNESEFLIERLKTREGYHIYMYPFEGRFVHEGMAAIIAYRISRIRPVSFSIGLNDYGFELLSDVEVDLDQAIHSNLFSNEHLIDDLQTALNHSEMAGRRFRDIAGIAGLVFKGYPGQYNKDKHLQASSRLFFEVFRDYESQNLLYRQAYREILEFQVEEVRLRAALKRINQQRIVITRPERPTPFCFPILADRLREKYSNESVEERLKRMILQSK